jgi:hypothetical protein
MDNTVILLTKMASACSIDGLRSIIEFLSDANHDLTFLSANLLHEHPGFCENTFPTLVDFVKLMKSNVDHHSTVLITLQTALALKEEIQQTIPEIEIAWTGPATYSKGRFRSTFDIMKDMLIRARTNILLVGYSFSITSEHTRQIMDELIQAKRRGCHVEIALHDDRRNIAMLRNYWPESVGFPIFLTWQNRNQDEMASLHAKLLIVDEREMLIGSANFSYHGMSANIEAGVRITGPVGQQMYRKFLALQTEKILQELQFNGGGDS